MKKISILILILSCLFTGLSAVQINAEQQVETTTSPQGIEEVSVSEEGTSSFENTSEVGSPVAANETNQQVTKTARNGVVYPATFESIFESPELAQVVAENFFRDASDTVTQEELRSIRHLTAKVKNIGNHFGGLEELSNLLSLDLASNNITDITLFDWNLLPNLKTLELAGNNISDVTQFDFTTLSGLWDLGLSYNGISTIEGVDWTPLTELVRLDLSYNNLDDLSTCHWIGLEKVEGLGLAGNKITTLSNADWTGLDSIRIVYFTDNLITDIKTSDFEGLSTMITFDMNENLVSDMSNMDWSYFPNLQGIQLEKNKISDINTFDWTSLRTVKSIGLRYNEISDVSGVDWTAFDEFWYIELSNNHIRDLSVINWDALSSLVYIGVEDQEVELSLEEFKQLLSLDVAVVDYQGEIVEPSSISHGGIYETTSKKITWNLQTNVSELSYEWNQPYTVNGRELEFNGTVTVPLGEGYSVVFKDYDNSILLSEIKSVGSPLTIPAEPKRAGYEFKEWKLVSTFPAIRNLNTTGIIHTVVPAYPIEYIATYTLVSPTVSPQPTTNPGRTCQDDGYAKGYVWNGTACVLEGAYVVPNTGVK